MLTLSISATVFLNQGDYKDESSWFDEGVTLWTWIILSLVSTIVLGTLICLFYKTYVSCKKKNCEENLITCYLCIRKVPMVQWRQGRVICMYCGFKTQLH